MADGDLATRAGPYGEDEFGELGTALDELARGYAKLVTDHRRERDRMRGVLAGMREGVLLLDRSRRVALVNPALREMLLLGADVEGKSPLEVIRHSGTRSPARRSRTTKTPPPPRSIWAA